MDLGLTGKVALVTGGSKGIGKAVARGLVQEGARVAICARTQTDLDAAATELARPGGEVFSVTGDLTREADVQRIVDATVRRFGRIDVLVNNAGAAPGGLLLDLTEEDWHQALELKFMGYVRCMKAVIPHMLRQGGGRIVNIVGNGSVNLSGRKLDLTILVAPFTTTDSVIKKIPILKDILGGSLITIPVRVKGPFDKLVVKTMPPDAVGEGLTGMMKRTLQLPFKIIEPIIPGTKKKS